MIQRLHVARELHEVLRPASAVVIGALGVVFSVVVSYRIGDALGLAGTVAILALTVMLATMLIGFLMLAIRQEAVSQIIALLVLERASDDAIELRRMYVDPRRAGSVSAAKCCIMRRLNAAAAGSKDLSSAPPKSRPRRSRSIEAGVTNLSAKS